MFWVFSFLKYSNIGRTFKASSLRIRERVQWLRVVTALPEDLHLVSGIHVWRSLLQLHVATAPGSLMSCYPRVPVCTWHVNTQIAIKIILWKPVIFLLTSFMVSHFLPSCGCSPSWGGGGIWRSEISAPYDTFYLQITTFLVLLASQSESCLHFPVCSVNRKCFQYITIWWIWLWIYGFAIS